MTPAELAQLKKFDKIPVHLLDTMQRAEYITLLRKLRRQVQLSLDLLQEQIIDRQENY